jgi:signal transduction histidine kinase
VHWRPSLRSRVKLLVGGMFVLLLIVVLGTMLVRIRIDTAVDHLATAEQPAQTAVGALTRSYVDQNGNVWAYLISGDPAFRQAYQAGESDATRYTGALRGQVGDDPTSARLLDQVEAAANSWRGRFVGPNVTARANSPEARLPDPAAARQDFDVLRARLAELDARIDQLAAERTARISGDRVVTNSLRIGTVLLAVLVAGTTVFVLRRSLTRPLGKLTSQVRAVARGDLDRPVQPTGPPDLVLVAEAVETMRVRILEQSRQAAVSERRFALYEESERIAEGLHRRVIQRLFAMELTLQSVAERHPRTAATLSTAIDDIDLTIREIRAVISGLSVEVPRRNEVRQRVLEVVAYSERSLGFTPRVQFGGPVDEAVTEDVAAELVPALRETLDDVAGTATPDRVEVSLEVADGALLLRVSSHCPTAPTSPTAADRTPASARQRAERLGGTCAACTTPDTGTTIDWRVPVQRTGLTQRLPHRRDPAAVATPDAAWPRTRSGLPVPTGPLPDRRSPAGSSRVIRGKAPRFQVTITCAPTPTAATSTYPPGEQGQPEHGPPRVGPGPVRGISRHGSDRRYQV